MWTCLDGTVEHLIARVQAGTTGRGKSASWASLQVESDNCAMSAKCDATLKSFLESQDLASLVAVLLELADDHDAVRQRLARLQVASKPAKLAAAFRRTLSGWQRSERFLGHDETRAFGGELEGWLAQVERELLPRDPAAARDLAEAFIASDGSFFERADDSNGDIGAAVAAGCRLWLQAAARCESPVEEWPPRIHQLVSQDDYGAREALLREAGVLLDTNGLRDLARLYEQDLHAALARGTTSQSLPTGVFAAAGALCLISDAMGDPDLHVRSVLAYSPQPNALQVREFVGAYLRHGRPADALAWLEDPACQVDENSRKRLLAETLRALDRRSEAAVFRQQLFEKSLDVIDLHEWLDDVAPPERPAAMQQAHDLALRHSEPVAAAQLLLELSDDELAEAILIQGEASLQRHGYVALVPLARELDRRERWRGATCVYRALLDGVLARAYSPAYPHAANYWGRLQAIADRGADLAPLQGHAAYAGQIKRQHARKSRFWACVAEAGGPL